MKTINAKISVIVPCYNQAQYLPDSLNSIFAQTYTNWECIIVNDGSPDNTEEVAMDWCKKDKRFKYLKKENGGLASARNAGIKIALGKYILPLDADDKISSIYLEEASNILDNKSDIGIVYCNAEYFGERSGKWDLPDYSEEKILFANIIFCCALFRKCDYLETCGYNQNMIYGWEDWDFWLSLIEKDKKVFKLQDVHFYYRINKDNSMIKDLNLNLKKQKYSFKTIFANHFDFYFNKLGHKMFFYLNLKSKFKLIWYLVKSKIKKILKFP